MLDFELTKLEFLEERKSLKLNDVANRLKLSPETIIEVLTQGGFVISKNRFKTRLSVRQIDYLAFAYNESLINYYKKLTSSYKELLPNKANKLRDSLSRFIRNSQDLTLDELFNSEIDSELSIDFFYQLIYLRPEQIKQNPVYYILREIKFRKSILSINKGITIFSIDINKHNHIYPDEEEDYKRLAYNITSFSFVSNTFREARINTFNYLMLLKWIIKSHLLKI
jgi:hypothetical protein